MASLRRAFLAVYPPGPVVDALADRLAPLHGLPGAPRIRWVRRDQWHLTVRFCGRVPDAGALVGAVGDALAGSSPVPGLELLGAGAFPKARSGSVLWVGFAGGQAASELGRVAAATEAACVDAGLAPDDRAFRAHLTVARAPRPCDLRPLIEGFGPEPVGPRWTADAVVLMVSDTRSDGAVHEEIARFPLGG